MLERKDTYINDFKQHVRSSNILLYWYSLIRHWIEECRKENPNIWTFSNRILRSSEGEVVVTIGIPRLIPSSSSLGRFMLSTIKMGLI